MLSIAVFLCILYLLFIGSIMKTGNKRSWLLFKGFPIVLALLTLYLYFLDGKTITF